MGDGTYRSFTVRLRGQTFREPDITVWLTEHLDHFGERYAEGADLIVEGFRADVARVLNAAEA